MRGSIPSSRSARSKGTRWALLWLVVTGCARFGFELMEPTPQEADLFDDLVAAQNGGAGPGTGGGGSGSAGNGVGGDGPAPLIVDASTSDTGATGGTSSIDAGGG